MMILLDKKPSNDPGNAMWKSKDGTPSHLFKPQDFVTTGSNMQSLFDINTRRYVVLMNKVWKIYPQAAAQLGPSMILKKFWVPMKYKKSHITSMKIRLIKALLLTSTLSGSLFLKMKQVQ